MSGMREDELRKFINCANCGKTAMESGIPLFFKVTAERHGLDAKAIQKQQGLTMMMGGHAGLARVMGTDPEMTKVISKRTFMLCEKCAGEPLIFYGVALKPEKEKEEAHADSDG